MTEENTPCFDNVKLDFSTTMLHQQQSEERKISGEILHAQEKIEEEDETSEGKKMEEK